MRASRLEPNEWDGRGGRQSPRMDLAIRSQARSYAVSELSRLSSKRLQRAHGGRSRALPTLPRTAGRDGRVAVPVRPAGRRVAEATPGITKGQGGRTRTLLQAQAAA